MGGCREVTVMEERGSYGELCASKGALQSRAFGRIRLLYAYSNNQNWIDSVIEMEWINIS